LTAGTQDPDPPQEIRNPSFRRSGVAPHGPTRLHWATATDPGRVRTANEDACRAIPESGLFILADGMGGSAAGALAADIVVQLLPDLLARRLKSNAVETSDDACSAIEASLSELSEMVLEKAETTPALLGMGSTVVTAWLREQADVIAHMGDSRAYLLQKGRLNRLTQDHNLAQILDPAGQPPAFGGEQLLRYIGMRSEPLPEARIISLDHGDRLLLCSDGLTNMLDDQTLARILSSASAPRETCDELVTAANRAGGRDNITVMVLDVISPP